MCRVTNCSDDSMTSSPLTPNVSVPGDTYGREHANPEILPFCWQDKCCFSATGTNTDAQEQ